MNSVADQADAQSGEQSGEQPDAQLAFARSIRSWDVHHLARCLVSADVNEAAKAAIRAELLRRGVDLDKAAARAAFQTSKAASAESPLTSREKVLVWGPPLVIFCAIAVGLYFLG